MNSNNSLRAANAQNLSHTLRRCCSPRRELEVSG